MAESNEKRFFLLLLFWKVALGLEKYRRFSHFHSGKLGLCLLPVNIFSPRKAGYRRSGKRHEAPAILY